MTHVPMCHMCGDYEIGTFNASDEFCSTKCETMYYDGMNRVEVPNDSDTIGDSWSHDDMLELSY